MSSRPSWAQKHKHESQEKVAFAPRGAVEVENSHWRTSGEGGEV